MRVQRYSCKGEDITGEGGDNSSFISSNGLFDPAVGMLFEREKLPFQPYNGRYRVDSAGLVLLRVSLGRTVQERKYLCEVGSKAGYQYLRELSKATGL